jgi:hypothetical protein
VSHQFVFSLHFCSFLVVALLPLFIHSSFTELCAASNCTVGQGSCDTSTGLCSCYSPYFGNVCSLGNHNLSLSDSCSF